MRIEMLTGWQCKTAQWDAANETVVVSKKETSTADTARNIASLRLSIDNAFTRCQLDGKTPTRVQIEDVIHDAIGTPRKSADTSVLSSIDRFMLTAGRQNGWSTSSVKKFITLKNHIRAWQPSLDLADLDESTFQEFVRYLNRQGFRNTYIAKTLGVMRWFCSWAEKEGSLTLHDYADFRPRLKGTDGASKEIIFLETDELMAIYNCEFTDRPGLASCRDVFCFCCFSGLRYSDAAHLHISDIHSDHIDIVTQKTGDRISIELNQYTRAILSRYEGMSFSCGRERDLALPIISNQKMNTYLKEIASRARVDAPTRIVYYKGAERFEELHPKYKLITTHCARRTFVVTALQLGIPADVIMKWTGHADYKSMKPYIAIADRLKKESMAKFDTLQSSTVNCD